MRIRHESILIIAKIGLLSFRKEWIVIIAPFG